MSVTLDEVLALLVAKDALLQAHPDVDRAKLTNGIALVLGCKTTWRDGIWEVRSQADARKKYAVDVEKGTCTCPDHVNRGDFCKHLCAGYISKCEREIFIEMNARERRAMLATA